MVGGAGRGQQEASLVGVRVRVVEGRGVAEGGQVGRGQAMKLQLILSWRVTDIAIATNTEIAGNGVQLVVTVVVARKS